MLFQPRSITGKLPIILITLLFTSIACAIPVSFNAPQPMPTTPPQSPLILPPTETFPAAPSETALPAATELPPTPSEPPPAPTDTRAPTPANTKAPAQLSEVTIYFVAVGDNGQSGPLVGCGDSLVAAKQPIQPTSGVIRAALTKLFSYKDQYIGQSGLYNALYQSDLTWGSGSVKDGVATIYLTGKWTMGGECDIPRFKGQIVQTILAQPGVKQANVFLNGKPIDEALSLK